MIRLDKIPQNIWINALNKAKGACVLPFWIIKIVVLGGT